MTCSNYEYTKPQPYPLAFKNFTDIPQTFNTMRISNLTDFTLKIAEHNPAGARELFVTATFKNSAKMQKRFSDLASQTVQSIQDTEKLVFSLSFQLLPQTVIGYGDANGGNSLGLGREDGDIVNVLLIIQWGKASDDDAINKAARDLFAKAEAAPKATIPTARICT